MASIHQPKYLKLFSLPLSLSLPASISSYIVSCVPVLCFLRSPLLLTTGIALPRFFFRTYYQLELTVDSEFRLLARARVCVCVYVKCIARAHLLCKTCVSVYRQKGSCSSYIYSYIPIKLIIQTVPVNWTISNLQSQFPLSFNFYLRINVPCILLNVDI